MPYGTRTSSRSGWVYITVSLLFTRCTCDFQHKPRYTLKCNNSFESDDELICSIDTRCPRCGTSSLEKAGMNERVARALKETGAFSDSLVELGATNILWFYRQEFDMRPGGKDTSEILLEPRSRPDVWCLH